MRINKKYLGETEIKTVLRLDDQQDSLKIFIGKEVIVRHYRKPYEWNFYIEYSGEKKKRFWYPFNFTDDFWI